MKAQLLLQNLCKELKNRKDKHPPLGGAYVMRVPLETLLDAQTTRFQEDNKTVSRRFWEETGAHLAPRWKT